MKKYIKGSYPKLPKREQGYRRLRIDVLIPRNDSSYLTFWGAAQPFVEEFIHDLIEEDINHGVDHIGVTTATSQIEWDDERGNLICVIRQRHKRTGLSWRFRLRRWFNHTLLGSYLLRRKK